jgi:hypothetical protein
MKADRDFKTLGMHRTSCVVRSVLNRRAAPMRQRLSGMTAISTSITQTYHSEIREDQYPLNQKNHGHKLHRVATTELHLKSKNIEDDPCPQNSQQHLLLPEDIHDTSFRGYAVTWF